MKFLPLIALTFFLISCSEENINADPPEDLSVLSMEILGNLSDTYPAEDIVLKVAANPVGKVSALFQLTGESKENAQLGLFAGRLANDDGTDCNNALSCGKAIKKCLDDGKDALISSGACAVYCVTCQDPE